MKKILLLFIVMAMAFTSYAQVEVLNENFDAGALPAGWTIEATNGAVNLTPGPCNTTGVPFSFQCSHNPYFTAGDNPSFSGTCAMIDDDNNGGGVDGIMSLLSPVMDFTGGGGSVTLDYENADFAGTGDFIVEAWDGAAWVELFREEDDAFGSVDEDLAAFTNADFQLKFSYDDEIGWNWGAAFDNVIATAFAPAGGGGGTTACFLDCPGDIVINLPGGECCWTAEYNANTEGCTPAYSFIQASQGAPVGPFTAPFDPSAFGEYDPAAMFPPNFNNEFVLNSAASPSGVSMFDFSNLPSSIFMECFDNSAACSGNGDQAWWNFTMINFVASSATTLTFDWTYHTEDADGAFWDRFGYMENGVWGVDNNISDINGADDQSGTFTYTFAAGDHLTLYVRTLDFIGCGADITMGVSAPAPITDGIVHVSGPYLGDEVCYGNTETVKLHLLKGGNVIDSCEFDIIVNKNVPTSNQLGCGDNIQVSMDDNCGIAITAEMFLEGADYGCFDDDYNVYIEGLNGNQNGNTVNLAAGTYTVTVEETLSGVANSCWSTMTVEDKLIPVIECDCPDISIGGLPSQFVGNLTANSPTWTRPFVNGGNCNPSGVGVDIPYQDFTFTITGTGSGNAGFDVVTFTAPSNDTYIALYENSFDPTDPCLNLVDANDDGGAGFLSAFTVELFAGTTYTFVVTTFNNNGNDFGAFVVEAGVDLDPACVVKCYDVEYGVAAFAPPVITDCSAVTVVSNDEVVGDICGQQLLRRTTVVTDAAGMTAQCVQLFEVQKLTFADITIPQTIVDLDCGYDTDPASIAALFDNPLTKDNVNTPWVENHEGWPVAYPHFFIQGHPQKIDNSICNILTSYSDQVIDACGADCGGNKKVIRTWTYMDWCTNALGTSIQVIKAVDHEEPTFQGLEDITLSTNPWGCEADFCAPAPQLHDNCSDNITYTVSVLGGTVVWDNDCNAGEGGYYVSGLGIGTHVLTYLAEDCCGLIGSYSINVTIEDHTPPVAVAYQNIVVSLTSSSTNGDGIAKIYGNSVNNNSHDGCTDVFVELRREDDPCNFRGNTTYNADGHSHDGSANPNSPNYDPDGGQYVKFCCADLTDTDESGVQFGMVTVWMRVWDLNGNFNETWVKVRVEDKLAPAIQCPPDIQIYCDMDPNDLSLTGEGSAYSTCDNAEVEWNNVVENLDACGSGFIIRRWSIPGGAFCDQRIDVILRDPFNGNIKWPQNKDASCLGVDPGEPTWTGGACDLIGHSNTRDTFVIEEGGCYKVLIHWTVIDWCQYEENFPQQDPNGNGIQDGIWRKDQIVKVVDDNAPVLDCQDVMFAVDDNADADNDGNICEKIGIQLTNVATDEGDCPSAWLKWNVSVDTWGDGTVDYAYSSHVPKNWKLKNGHPKEYVAPTASGETVTITLPEGVDGSMFNHVVTWKVTDGCGNVRSCTSTFMVVDKKAPTPYCLNLSSAIMQSPSCMVELWAIDFDKSSFDNCTAQGDLRFTFTDTKPQDDPLYSAADRSSARVFTQADVGPTPIALNVYVWDEKDNYDFCTVMLTLISNDPACNGDGSMIAGSIQTDAGVSVGQTHVTVETNEFSADMMAVDGEYAFNNISNDNSYTVGAARNTDYMEGVSTLDLLLIQRHILKLKEFNNAYTLFAADINADATINASDLIQLRKLILGKYDALPNNTSWRFGDRTQVFGDLNEVLTNGLNEVLTINPLTIDMMDEDFVALKVGDVDNSIDNLLQGLNNEVRTNKAVTLNAEEQSVVAGTEVAVTFTSADFNEVYGYQTGLSLNGLEFVAVEAGAVSMSDDNIAINRNNMNISWSNVAPLTVGNEGLFTITFRATKDGSLSSMLTLNAASLSTEAYVGDNATVVNLDMNIGTEEATNALLQNEPNPFRATTTVAYELASAGTATLTVYNVTGQKVLTLTSDAHVGMNTFTVNKSDLNASGVMYYTLESGDFTATKKMIIIE